MPLTLSYLEKDVFDKDGIHHWKLRYLCSTSTGEKGNGWLTSLFCRHGGHCFPGWWKCEHSAKCKSNCSGPYTSHNGEIPIRMWNEWNIAVYIQVETVEFEKVCDQFLVAVGGQ